MTLNHDEAFAGKLAAKSPAFRNIESQRTDHRQVLYGIDCRLAELKKERQGWLSKFGNKSSWQSRKCGEEIATLGTKKLYHQNQLADLRRQLLELEREHRSSGDLSFEEFFVSVARQKLEYSIYNEIADEAGRLFREAFELMEGYDESST